MRVTPGEASRVAVLAVDEGILQVARYKNPDPLGYFFQKRMLEVETTQILDLILPEFKRFLALAAPAAMPTAGFARHLNPFNKNAKRRWLVGPACSTWAGGPRTPLHGARLFQRQVAHRGDRREPAARGRDGRPTEVKASFILTPNVPAMVAPGDEFMVSVGVFNNTVRGKGPIHVEVQASPELSPLGQRRSISTVPDKKEGVGEFRFKANALLGAASLKFIATRGTARRRRKQSRRASACGRWWPIGRN